MTSLLFDWLNTAKHPDDKEMEGTFRELCYYLARFIELLMNNGIVVLLNNSDDGATTTFRASVPKRARQRILELAHISTDGGHFGVQKTLNKLKQRFFSGIALHETTATCINNARHIIATRPSNKNAL